jgi:cold-inducible RNA-binding protein
VPKRIFSIESIGKMETKLYIGNMSKETTEQDLRTMFSEAGTVGTVDVIMDRQTGKPKGFAFVMMSSQAEAEKAISMFNAKDVNAHTLKVNVSLPREERPASGGYPNK